MDERSLREQLGTAAGLEWAALAAQLGTLLLTTGELDEGQRLLQQAWETQLRCNTVALDAGLVKPPLLAPVTDQDGPQPADLGSQHAAEPGWQHAGEGSQHAAEPGWQHAGEGSQHAAEPGWQRAGEGSQHAADSPHPAADSPQQPAAALADSVAQLDVAGPGPATPAADLRPSPAGSDASEQGGWDASSEDWEPDVSALRSAHSFERQHGASTSSLRSAGSWRAQEPPAPAPGSRADAAASWRSSGGGRPRGRGKSKAGRDSSDSGDDAVAATRALPHILEVYELHRGIKTAQLEEWLLHHMWGGAAATVKWADDEHALAVFPCAEAASALLESGQREFKVRPYAQASSASLAVSPEELLPPRAERPKTTTAVARRLISNALGNRQVRDREAERELAGLRRAKKEEKQQRQAQLAAAWGGDEGSP